MTTKSFTGKDFAKALSDGTLKGALERIGMAKKDESNPRVILFAEGACTSWLQIPVDLVEQVDYLSTVKCRDHEHPLVQIRFKEPAADNEAARLYADLARFSASSLPSSEPGESTTALPGVSSRSIGVGSAGGGFGLFGIQGCGCLRKELVCHIEYIRYAPGKFLPVPVCEYRCTHWECDTR